MSDGAKIALAVAGVAIVGFFVLKSTGAIAAHPAAGVVAPSNTATAFISGIFSLGTAAINANRPNPNVIAATNPTDITASTPVYTNLGSDVQISPGSED